MINGTFCERRKSCERERQAKLSICFIVRAGNWTKPKQANVKWTIEIFNAIKWSIWKATVTTGLGWFNDFVECTLTSMELDVSFFYRLIGRVNKFKIVRLHLCQQQIFRSINKWIIFAHKYISAVHLVDCGWVCFFLWIDMDTCICNIIEIAAWAEFIEFNSIIKALRQMAMYTTKLCMSP